jgi:beta-mannosidase
MHIVLSYAMPQDVPNTTVPLTSNWTFKQGPLDSTAEYLPANDLPTEVHRDLLKNKKIADPFLDLNELSVRWVAEETWTYRTTFPTPLNHGEEGVKTVLSFEGLDTFASVYLNGKPILDSENMFVGHRVDVSSDLQVNEEENVLEIVFKPARKKGLELVKEHPEHKFIVHQTEVSRGPVRKAQCHWGWDWGPILLTSGPWKPIVLETYVSRIEDVWVEYELSDDLKTAKGKLFCKIEGPVDGVVFRIRKAESTSSFESEICFDRVRNSVWQANFEQEVELWWPRGYGPQTLYEITARMHWQPYPGALTETLAGNGDFRPYACAYPNCGKRFIQETALEFHQRTHPRESFDRKRGRQFNKYIGFRKAELIQNKDAVGTSFYFRINNVDIFVGGSCWIPADSLLTQISPERYREWLQLAATGNQTMIRVWGGGIYEHDAFYEACDELGLLVWQDFMFACANYPAYPSYLQSVETEARQNVRRLRHHPSIVLWCGNNEDYQIVERYGLEYRYEEDKDPQSWLKTDFPARYIYEYLLPKIVEEEADKMPYHPSSPFGNGTSTTLKVDPTVGDIHQWNVWHGDMKPYQQLPTMGGRFVSEFGMEAYPHLETLKKYITREEDRYPGSMAMDFRNKAIGHERRLVSYVTENFRMGNTNDLESFAHLTQVMQADAMTWAYKNWRRQWGTEGKRQCGGVLVWQLNDCWPTISWAVIDHYRIPKPAYYAIKRAMEPVDICVTRKVNDWTMRPADELWKRDTAHINMRKIWEDVEFDLWISNIRPEPREGKIIVRFISIRSGEEIRPAIFKDVHIEPNGTTEVYKNYKVEVPQQDPNEPYDISKADPFVIKAHLATDRQEVTMQYSWPEPIKYLDFSDRGLTIEYKVDGSLVRISAPKPVKGFVFSEREGVTLSDNGFDIMPGWPKGVRVTGGRAQDLKWRYVGM